jgi:hypothetical protein
MLGRTAYHHSSQKAVRCISRTTTLTSKAWQTNARIGKRRHAPAESSNMIFDKRSKGPLSHDLVMARKDAYSTR